MFMKKVPADSKLEAAKHNVSGAIVLFMAQRWFNSWCLAQIAGQVIAEYLEHEGKKALLAEPANTGDEFSGLALASRRSMNAVKHADSEKRLSEGVYHSNAEDAQAFILFAILDLLKLEADLLPEHELFIAWYRTCWPQSKPFPCPKWALHCFAGLEGKALNEQCRRGLEIILEKGVLPTSSHER